MGDTLVNDLPPKERDIVMVLHKTTPLSSHECLWQPCLDYGGQEEDRWGEEGRRGWNFIWAWEYIGGGWRSLPKKLRYMTNRERKKLTSRCGMWRRCCKIGSPLKGRNSYLEDKVLLFGRADRVVIPKCFFWWMNHFLTCAKLRAETRAQIIVKLQTSVKTTTTIYVTRSNWSDD